MPIVYFKQILMFTCNRYLCLHQTDTSVLFFAHSVLPQIFLTPESLSWYEVLKVGGAKYHSLVAPSGHILLPFGDGVVWICRVAVWLCVGIHGSAFMLLAEALQSLPPVV